MSDENSMQVTALSTRSSFIWILIRISYIVIYFDAPAYANYFESSEIAQQ